MATRTTKKRTTTPTKKRTTTPTKKTTETTATPTKKRTPAPTPTARSATAATTATTATTETTETTRVEFGGLIFFQQGGPRMICFFHPGAPLTWHPDADAEFVDVDGVRSHMTVRRTARPKTLAAGAEPIVEADFDDDAPRGTWLLLRLMNRGQPTELWNADAVDDLRRARKWPPASLSKEESAAAVAARQALVEAKKQAKKKQAVRQRTS